jgi:uncharacterized membrane protein
VAVDSVVVRIPVLGGLYKASSQIVDTFGDDNAFQRVVLTQLFGGGYTPVFVTSETIDTATGEKWLWVFLPMFPNPTSGFSFVVREKDAIATEFTPQETLKRMMSLGTLMPDAIKLNIPPQPPKADQ